MQRAVGRTSFRHFNIASRGIRGAAWREHDPAEKVVIDETREDHHHASLELLNASQHAGLKASLIIPNSKQYKTGSLGRMGQLGLHREHTVLQPRRGRLQSCSGIPRQKWRLCCATLPAIRHRLQLQHGQHGLLNIMPSENQPVSEKRLPFLLLEVVPPQ